MEPNPQPISCSFHQLSSKAEGDPFKYVQKLVNTNFLVENLSWIKDILLLNLAQY